jgi:transcriptional regulator with GAF, ATPase, and Fis domain
MCNYSGYESVALIPLRVGNKTLGLIQLNDPRENMFTLTMIKKYESIADQVSAVVCGSFEIQERLNVISDMVNKTKGFRK